MTRNPRSPWPEPLDPDDTDTVEPVAVPVPCRHSWRQIAPSYVMHVVTLALFAVLAYFQYVDHQYVLGRGEYRDAQDEREEERMNDYLCRLLAMAPADSAQADQFRAELNCPQPGIPYADLPPELQAEVSPPQRPAPTRAPVAPPPDFEGDYAPAPTVPAVPTTPATPPGQPAESPPPADPLPLPAPPFEGDPGLIGSLDDALDPLTDPLCRTLGICI